MHREQQRTNLRQIGRQRDPGHVAAAEIGFLDERETALAQLRRGGARPVERLEPRQVHRTGHHARRVIQRMGVQQRRHTLQRHQKHQQQQGAKTVKRSGVWLHRFSDHARARTISDARITPQLA